MIVAERKPIAEILAMLEGFSKVLLVGCKGCVTVCNAGGRKEVGILASLIRLARAKENKPIEVTEHTLERQCDNEYIDELDGLVQAHEAVLSMACSVGPQFLAKKFPMVPVYPCLNTCFMGGALEHGVWAEFCQGCGNCRIHMFGAMCPIARCSKSLANGPCGGSAGGKCEISKEVDCVWHLIVEKLMDQGKLEQLKAIPPVRDWSTSRDGGPRKIVREDLKL